MYQVKLICRDDNGKTLREKISLYKWDSRDMAQMYGISLYQTVLDRDKLDYFVTDFQIIDLD